MLAAGLPGEANLNAQYAMNFKEGLG